MPCVHMHTVTYTSWPGSHFGIGDEPSLASLEARDTLCANLLSSTLPELYACRAASRSRVAPLLRCLTVEGASGEPGMANKLQRHTEGAQWASNASNCSTLTWLKWLCCVKGVVCVSCLLHKLEQCRSRKAVDMLYHKSCTTICEPRAHAHQSSSWQVQQAILLLPLPAIAAVVAIVLALQVVV